MYSYHPFRRRFSSGSGTAQSTYSDGTANEIANLGAFNDWDGLGDFSISFWLKDVGGTSGVFGHWARYAGGTNRIMQLRAATNRIYIYRGSGYGYFVHSGYGSWTHYVYRMSSAGAVLAYINGASKPFASISIFPSANPTMSASGAGMLHGYGTSTTNVTESTSYIYDFAAWDGLLSNADITDLYNQTKRPGDITTGTMISHWNPHDPPSSGTSLIDQGTGGNNATLINGCNFELDVP
jgi:hypothetical protein